MHLSNQDVREILKLLDESPYDELKIESEGFSLTLKCKSAAKPSQGGDRLHGRGRMTGTRHG